jgi:16S rRNA G966 N2-methylase RsmD
MNQKIYYNKLFPKLNGISIKNLQIDNESISYITTPSEAEKITSIIESHTIKIKQNNLISIIDATGGVGGDTIAFCKKFGNVISIEDNYERYKILLHNITQYAFKNVTVINANSTLIIPKISDIDVIYIDPPWGGKDYKFKENLRLTLDDLSIEEFILKCFNNDLKIKPLFCVLKLPKNYDIKYFYSILSYKFEIYLYELYKFNIFILEIKEIQLIDLR